jgi:hypothetical protein
MKWDIDKALKPLEPERLIGTSITRFYLDIDLLKQEKLKITPETLERRGTHGWCLGVGHVHLAKAFFYGLTIRECFLRARKAAKQQTLDQVTPWGRQEFKPKLKKAKPKSKTRKS